MKIENIKKIIHEVIKETLNENVENELQLTMLDGKPVYFNFDDEGDLSIEMPEGTRWINSEQVTKLVKWMGINRN